MAVQLFKLAATSPNVTTTDKTYFYKVSVGFTVTPSGTYKLSVGKWSTGSGGTATSFAKNSKGYYNLFINGVLQQSILYTVVSNSSVHLHNTGAASYSIPTSSPITLGLAASSITPAEVVIP